jgi:hypothetical protein
MGFPLETPFRYDGDVFQLPPPLWRLGRRRHPSPLHDQVSLAAMTGAHALRRDRVTSGHQVLRPGEGTCKPPPAVLRVQQVVVPQDLVTFSCTGTIEPNPDSPMDRCDLSRNCGIEGGRPRPHPNIRVRTTFVVAATSAAKSRSRFPASTIWRRRGSNPGPKPRSMRHLRV